MSTKESQMPEDQTETIEMVIKLLQQAKINYRNGKFSDYNQNIFTAQKGIGFVTEELIQAVKRENEAES